MKRLFVLFFAVSMLGLFADEPAQPPVSNPPSTEETAAATDVPAPEAPAAETDGETL
ncbi:MAG: hypothetical protein WC371_02745 [Parachlamydiales bacterium]|jgi:hypothetical protein